MLQCQICNVCSGKHKIEIQGLCGSHAEEIKEFLHWWVENKETLKKINIKKLGKKF